MLTNLFYIVHSFLCKFYIIFYGFNLLCTRCGTVYVCCWSFRKIAWHKKVSRKILEIWKSPDGHSGDSVMCLPAKFIFTAVRLCSHYFCNKFLPEGSPKFWGDNTFCQKISKFWKILEIFGNFWKILTKFWKNVPAEKNFGNFWKFLQKFSKIVKSWKFRGL